MKLLELPPTQVLKQLRVPNYKELQEHLEALIQLQLKFRVECFEYSGDGNKYPRFVITVYV